MTTVRHNNGGVPDNGTPVLSKTPESPIFKLLDFFGDEWKTALDVGRFLGVEHKAQAIARGSVRLKAMLSDNLVYRGTQIADKDTTGDHAQYALTNRGKEMRRVRRILAKPSDVEALAVRRPTA